MQPILLPEPEIRNEDLLEISRAFHDVDSDKVRPRYVSQQEINDRSHAKFNLNFAGYGISDKTTATSNKVRHKAVKYNLFTS